MRINSDKANLGKIFETFVDKSFRELPSTLPCSWKRLVDTRAAGNFIGVAPADFEMFVLSKTSACPYVFYIECKSTDKFTEFSPFFRSAIKPQQRAEMMIRQRAGAAAFYFFFSSQTQIIEVWPANYINRMWPQKRVPLEEEPMMRVALDNLHELGRIFATQPEVFVRGAGI